MYTPQNNMITFGAYTWSGGTNEYYKGIIDEVRISNIARTPSDFDLNK
jgi:hypothetical protein